MWEKVKNGFASKRTKFAVRRASSRNSAILIIPLGAVSARRADIYIDGGGKVAFEFNEDGAYKVGKAGNSNCDAVSIPSKLVGLFPRGATDVELEMQGKLWVLDTSELNA